jgi:FkbM family methyltransferase
LKTNRPTKELPSKYADYMSINKYSFTKSLRHAARQKLREIGFDIQSLDTHKYKKIIIKHGITLVLDVGAGNGQYGLYLRSLGFSGKIVSFEPQKQSYQHLEKRMKKDHNWTGENIALGYQSGTANLNIAGNFQSSSLLQMLPLHEHAAPSSATIGQENVIISTVNKKIRSYASREDRILLKIDAQGSEHNILRGAAGSLPDIIGLQFEASLVPLYHGETLLPGLLKIAHENGFTPALFQNGFANHHTGQVYQVDVTCIKSNLL